jgi:hypothetical protein
MPEPDHGTAPLATVPTHPASVCRKKFRSLALWRMLLPRDDVSTLGLHYPVGNRGEMSPAPPVLPQPRCTAEPTYTLTRRLVFIIMKQKIDIFDLVHQNDTLDVQR